MIGILMLWLMGVHDKTILLICSIGKCHYFSDKKELTDIKVILKCQTTSSSSMFSG